MISCTRAGPVVAAVLAVGVLAVAGVAVGGCDAPAPPPPEQEPPADQCLQDTNKRIPAGAGAIYNGTRQPSLVPLDAAQQDAVVGVSDPASVAKGFGSFCSGTLISTDVVLTAQHCTSGLGDEDVVVLFGVDELSPRLVVPSVAVREHPGGLDLALIQLAFDPATQIAVTPIPVALAPPDEDQIGSLVENAGYGETDDGSEGRYFVTELYRGIFAGDFIVVDGEGRRGVCFGDSGGPSLHVSAQGDVRALGALSFGDDPCGSVDYYQRIDTVLSWVEELTGPTPRGELEACGDDVRVEGRCSAEQTLATWCEGGVVVREACAAGEICARTAAPSGEDVLRCIPVDENACGDVSTFGRCEDDTLLWCDNDVVKTRVCGACDGRCLLASDTFGFTCVASDCGGVDEQGVCDGTVSRWCDGTQLQSEDCAALGQPCAYVGPELGNYCYDAVACEGRTYAGSCEGSVVLWCEDGVPYAYDCADDGQPCGFIAEQDGFNCIEP